MTGFCDQCLSVSKVAFTLYNMCFITNCNIGFDMFKDAMKNIERYLNRRVLQQVSAFPIRIEKIEGNRCFINFYYTTCLTNKSL